MDNDKLIFSISKETVQVAAIKLINRSLNSKELLLVEKGIESGLLFDLHEVINVAISNAVESTDI